MKKTLSLKEIALLGIVIVALAYYFVFFKPLQNETAELNDTLANLQTEMDVNQTLLVKENAMQQEVSDSEAAMVVPLPLYNNSNNIITELNSILDSSNTSRFDVDFGEVVEEDSVVKREIRINFITDSYSSVTQKLTAIRDSENHYIINDVIINSDEGNAEDGSQAYSVTVNMTAHEYKVE